MVQLLCHHTHTVAPLLKKQKSSLRPNSTSTTSSLTSSRNSKSFEFLSEDVSQGRVIGQRPLLQNAAFQNEDMPQQEPAQLFQLGEDILLHIICRFLTPKYLLYLGQTCQYFHELCNEDILWHHLHLKRFRKPAICDNPKFSYYICRRLIIYKEYFATQPLHPYYGKQRCVIKRSKSSKVYTLALDNCTQFANQNVRLGKNFYGNQVLYAKKTNKCYLIATSKTFVAGSVLGRLEFDNLTKTRFTIKSAQNHTVGTIAYKLNLLGMLGPRRFQMMIPPVDTTDNTMRLELFSPIHKFGALQSESPADVYTETEHGILIPNKNPVWSNEYQQYLLDFGSHLHKIQSSVNNFKVENAAGETLWLLGKAHDSFCLDFQHPLSPLQAFALALSCFATHRNPTLVSFFDD